MPKPRSTPALLSALLSAFLAVVLAAALPAASQAQNLKTQPAQASMGAAPSAYDAVVEAVRQTTLAAQVSGAVVQLDAKAGDRVRAGQLLLRIDARAADQAAAASDAQVQAARAALDIASKDFERQKQLFQKNFISQAALDRAESEFKASQAQAQAQWAQAGAARTQSGFYVVRAPFAGVVADVPVSLGDMAMPGRALLTLYDPTALRVTGSVPQAVAKPPQAVKALRVEVPGLPEATRWVTPSQVQALPTVDAATHTVALRADLPAHWAGLSPGMFARLWLPLPPTPGAAGAAPAADRISVPLQAIVRRAELTALYVLDANGKPVLRQVRLGRIRGDRVEILTGLTAGEPVVTDPASAVRAR
jgi:RND family efflux transporter MFP subunit